MLVGLSILATTMANQGSTDYTMNNNKDNTMNNKVNTMNNNMDNTMNNNKVNTMNNNMDNSLNNNMDNIMKSNNDYTMNNNKDYGLSKTEFTDDFSKTINMDYPNGSSTDVDESIPEESGFSFTRPDRLNQLCGSKYPFLSPLCYNDPSRDL